MKKCGCILVALICIVISGCGITKANSIYIYRITGDDIVSSFYLTKTEYYSDKVVIYFDGTIQNLDSYSFSDGIVVKNKSLLAETDNPEEFNSFYMSREDESYSFRYLDTDQYACLYSVMDSEGGMHYSGSVDRYYTDEEKNKQNEQALKREQEQIELYERLVGTWTSEDGYYFRIYMEDNYTVEYSLADRTGTESAVVFINHLYAKENNIGISYIDGPFDVLFPIVLSEDGNSFEFEEKVFTRDKIN